MNESMPEPAPIAPLAPASPAFKDRSVGLIVFGILTTLLGCLAGLLTVFVMFASLAPTHANGGTPPPVGTFVFIILLYGGLSVALIWLGIGSILCHRWARALLLISSWFGLVVGVLAITALACFFPKIFANLPANPNGQPAVPAGAMSAVLAVMFVIYGFFLVILPAIWTFFYGGKNVKATCEARHPEPSWTDACPLPVLAVSLFQAFGAVTILFLPVISHGVMPFFGTFISGVAGTLYCLLLAVILGNAAWRLYRLEVSGWWTALITLVVVTISGLLTYAQHDILDMYRLMGYTQAQIDPIQKMGFLTRDTMIWGTLISLLPFLGYLLFIKKYFRREA